MERASNGNMGCGEEQMSLDTGDTFSSNRGTDKGLVVLQGLSRRCFSSTFTGHLPLEEARPVQGPARVPTTYFLQYCSRVLLPETLELNIVSKLPAVLLDQRE
jgi:hypothetical protein